MTKPHQIAIPIYPGLQSLDAVGPGQVFGTANQLMEREAYRITFVASNPGAIKTTAGFSLTADSLRSVPATSVDTLIVPGGDDTGVRNALADKPFMRWIAKIGRASCRERVCVPV